MSFLHIDCSSGVSGDMMLAALIDAGADLEQIQRAIDSLGLPECQLSVSEVKRHAFRALKLHVNHPEQHAHRHLHHIVKMLEQSTLNERQCQLAHQMFLRIGHAEAKVHGSTLEKVHFHEVGAVDSIADLVGTAVAIDQLGIEHVSCAPVPTGHGYIQIAHGRCSVPAPATAELLQGIPLATCDVEAELTTPTGAAIVATLAERFGPLPSMQIRAIGYGAGTADFPSQANILRLVLGDRQSAGDSAVMADTITLLQTNIDDASAEVIGSCMEMLLERGALDVYCTPIFMKKNRPGVELSVMSDPANASTLRDLIFQQTQSLGIRQSFVERAILRREPGERETPWGPVAGKWIDLPGGKRVFTPEFEACRQVAIAAGESLQTIMAAARGSSGSHS